MTRFASAPTRDCAHCGKPFKAVQEFSGFKRKYCSKRCTGDARHAQIVASYPPREEIQRLYKEERLTDRELGARFGHSYQWALTVRKHYGISGRPTGERARPKPLHERSERARWGIGMKGEGACRNCGAEGVTLHLHHVVPRSRSVAGKYDLRNGIPLCWRCHHGWHDRRVVLLRRIFSADEWDFIQTLIHESWLDNHYPVEAVDPDPRCRNGHPINEENTSYLERGKRRCKVCARERATEYRAKRREGAAA